MLRQQAAAQALLLLLLLLLVEALLLLLLLLGRGPLRLRCRVLPLRRQALALRARQRDGQRQLFWQVILAVFALCTRRGAAGAPCHAP